VEQFIGQQQAKIQQITDKQIAASTSSSRSRPMTTPRRLTSTSGWRALRRKAALQQPPGAQLRREDFPSRAEKNTSLAADLKKKQQDAEKIPRSGPMRQSRTTSSVEACEVRAHGRGVVPPRLLAADDEEDDRAREFFHRLIKDYPQSKYVPNAYLSFAEYYFAKGEMEKRAQVLREGEQFPKSSVYGFAVYKKGWPRSTWATSSRPWESSST